MSQDPQNRMTEADLRRTRVLCYVAAAVFAGCGAAFLATPFSLPVRAIACGLNVVVALAVVFYGRTLRAEN